MSDPPFGLDAAWERVTQARTGDDLGAQAVAWDLLAQTLHEEGRTDEAREIGRKAVDLTKQAADSREVRMARVNALMRRGAQWVEAAGPAQPLPPETPIADTRPAPPDSLDALLGEDFFTSRRNRHPSVYLSPEQKRMLDNAREAYYQAESALSELSAEPRNDLVAADPDKYRYEGSAADGAVDPGTVEYIVGGFLVVKALGPFVEAWAKKLGERLGESTVRALGRIRLKDKSYTVTVETSTPTTLVLPAELSDAAILALIDLDLTDEAVRGMTLYWYEKDGRWSTERRTRPEESLLDWTVRYTWTVSGKTVHTYAQVPTWLAGFEDVVQAAHEGGPDGAELTMAHIRRTYEQVWGDPVWPQGR